MDKIKLLVMFGGKSPEHDVSIGSAINILSVLDTEKYLIDLLYIDMDGNLCNRTDFQRVSSSFLNSKNILSFLSADLNLELIKNKLNKYYNQDINSLGDFINKCSVKRFDVIFPVFHGRNGEDGRLQGLLDFVDIPYVGCDVLGSALAMDKDMTKQICIANNISVADYITIRNYEWKKNSNIIVKQIIDNFSFPVFIKPANLGSSIGIRKVNYAGQLSLFIEDAFKYDSKILIEKGVEANEYGIGVIGNDDLILSVPAQYCSVNDFLDFDAKYGETALEDVIPAPLPQNIVEKLRKSAERIFKLIELSGMARVDFFIDDEEIILNEVNTIPGFGVHSVFFKIWEATGITKKELIDKLIVYALEKHKNLPTTQKFN